MGSIKRGESTSGKELPITRPIRQYFHARTNQPFASARELQDDSDCEDTNDWLHALSESLINDFDDVSDKEKTFMNLWNRFIKCHNVIADRDIPRRVETFILMNRDKLIGADLRMNLLLHLSNLWDYGLVSKHRISSCMAMYDDGEMPSGLT
ncbi:polycomb protein Suz12 [Skeletonema marinoi]|uniref:Polycomb protein Suz12 n=1 Tax=Skeletonema marinoi TaxID=267567 RepID=A0AAD9DII9_9STRA|nr:polycomb protein Suz12 [Skeletonema marinoi]